MNLNKAEDQVNEKDSK